MMIPKPYLIAMAASTFLIAAHVLKKNPSIENQVATSESQATTGNDSSVFSFKLMQRKAVTRSLIDPRLLEVSEKKMNYFGEYLESWLIRGMTGIAQDRKQLVALGAQDPYNFSKAMTEIMKLIPKDQTDIKEMILGLTIDVLNDSKKLSELSPQLNEKVMTEVYQMTEAELATEELIETKMVTNLTPETIEALVHDGILLEKNGRYYRSTLQSKILSLKLISYDLNSDRKSQFTAQVEKQKLGSMDSHTLETLKLAAAR